MKRVAGWRLVELPMEVTLSMELPNYIIKNCNKKMQEKQYSPKNDRATGRDKNVPASGSMLQERGHTGLDNTEITHKNCFDSTSEVTHLTN